MISLPVELVAEFAKDVHYIKHLVSIDFTSETVRYTDCDQNLPHGGHWYDSHPIGFDAVNAGDTLEANTLKVNVSNIDKKFSTLCHAENIKEKVFQLKRVLLSSALKVIGSPIVLFYGYTDSYHIDKEKAEISVADELIRWKTPVPRRSHSEHCEWKDFKGIECKYAGTETWCDRTKARCEALSNYDNFGGFSHVVELMDKEIWWGRIPKSFMNYGLARSQMGH